ncbi:MAG: histidine phosphatase family protein [Rhabdochlamydiaceae bacterium]|nr:histidine phosphatase family protein [Rhabdochlamydiaceae bacterium]
MNFLRKIYLIRHGETSWTLSGQHTGKTDLPLTPKGEQDALLLGKRLKGHTFEKILTSPLKRAEHTCELAGLAKHVYRDPDLVEWNYGDYEGLTTQEIHKRSPNWTIFERGAPNGESLSDVSARANKILAKIHSIHGDIALFSHGHFLRILAARWLNLPAQEGKHLLLSACSLSILSYERQTPVLALWNDTSHLQS